LKIARNVYAVLGLAHSTGFSVNAGFVIGNGETCIIDSGFTYLSAQTIQGYAQVAAPKNKISYVINTEVHADHVLGNCLFKETGAKIIAHEAAKHDSLLVNELIKDTNKELKTIGMKRRAEHNEGAIFFWKTHVANPDITITEDTTLNVGGEKIKLIMTSGHTETNISVYIPSEQVIFVGDLIYSKFLPTLRFGNKELWHRWVTSLKKLEKLPIKTLVPGHGSICCGKEVQEEIVRHKKILAEQILEPR